MKKLLTTTALIALGTVSALAAGGGKKIITTPLIKKANYKSLYILTTESGEKIKAFAWGKHERRVKRIIRKEQTATYTLGKIKNGQYKIALIEVMN